jgi:GH25 family lysozyme M1 (1,4-beta-N-acetylmuramidase)
VQAEYFIKHGGGWSADGITLPGMLDIEYEPDGPACWGVSQSAMVDWITEFVDTYHSAEKVWPLIYSTANWWEECTGNTDKFSKLSPLVLADYNTSPGTVPGKWATWSFWQNSDSYKYGGDSDIFNGDLTQLVKIAKG